MSTSREGPNPLRPYYRPPSIGIPQDTPGVTSSGTHGLGPKNGSAASYASSARDIFSDVDYSDYFSDSSPSSVESAQKLINDCLYKYFSVLLSQPFDVAKTVLQVRSYGAADNILSPAISGNMRSGQSSYRDSNYDDYQGNQYGSDSEDEPAYFTSSAPLAHSYSPSQSRRRFSDQSPSPPPPKKSAHQFTLKKPDSLLEVISQEWNVEGYSGVWKGSNVTFMYSFLLKTIENWSRGVLSALFNVPDPGSIVGLSTAADVVDGTYPWASLAVAVAAAVSAGLILAPVDLVRTKLILTPVSNAKRSATHNIRMLPSYFCPTPLMLPTILHSLITPAISHSTPHLLRSQFGIDPVLTPTTYGVCKFLCQIGELFVKLPFETVLRRGQVAVLASPVHSTDANELQTTVDIGPYKGVVGTMWSIAREEGIYGQDASVAAGGVKAIKRGKKAEKKGQGIEGLWRGWRVGMWGLVGVWGARAMGTNGSNGGEF